MTCAPQTTARLALRGVTSGRRVQLHEEPLLSRLRWLPRSRLRVDGDDRHLVARPASWLLAIILVAACGCRSGPELSDVVGDFCRGEMLLLELSHRALKEGRTDTILGDPSSRAFSDRVHSNFHFCRHARRIPEEDDNRLSTAYTLAHDRYAHAVRRDRPAAAKEMASMLTAYRKVLSYPLR
jgi:hypothetical protein